MDATKIINPGTITELLLNPDLRNKLKKGGNASESTIKYNSNDIIEVPLCVAATTGDITIAPTTTVIDGVTLAAGNLVLVWQQTNTTENGIYKFSDVATWQRFEPHKSGMLVSVWGGDTYAEAVFMLISDDTSIGQSLEFVQINDNSGGGGIADGTVNNSTLRWNGTDWVENTKILSNTAGTDTELTLYSPSSNTKFANLLATNSSSYLTVAQSSTNSVFGFAGGTYSLFNIKGDNTTSFNVQSHPSNSYITFGQSGILLFSVDNTGLIMSKHLQGTGNRLLYTSNDGKINPLSNATGYLRNDGSGGVAYEIPNRHSFLAADSIFNNLLSTFPGPVLTSYDTIGGTGFKVNLKANRRYAIEVRLMFANVGGTTKQFQIKVNNHSNWNTSSSLFTERDRGLILNWGDIDVLSFTQYTATAVTLDTEYAFYIDDDVDDDFVSLYIKGHIDTFTSTDGDFTISLRNIIRDQANNSAPFTVAQGSYIKAIECGIN